MSLCPQRHSKNSIPIAVYDIETTTDLKKVYLVGYYDGTTYKYWESEPLSPENPDSALALFLGWYLSEPRKQWLYAHNGGNFDNVFTLRYVMSQNDLSAEIIPVQSTILRLRILDDKHNKWDFLDSFRILPGSLDNLAQTFLGKKKVDINKDYENLMHNPMRYDYLKADCVLLYDILIEYRRRLEDKIGGRLALSIAGCAMKTFQMKHLKQELPSGSETSDRVSRDAYYGGRVEVFKKALPSGASATLYDVNSMYPWAMIQEQPIKLVGYKTGKNYIPNLNCIGFVKCRVEVPHDIHIPVLPYRQAGKLIFPTGTFHGTWTTVELKRALSFGVHITRHYESVWFQGGYPFLSYVRELYHYRNKGAANWDVVMDVIAKLLLNSFYGKFGSHKERETIHVRPPLEQVIAREMTPMDSPIPCPVFCEHIEVNNDYMLPHISAWITALSRVRWHEGASSVPYNSLCYGDTDSLVTYSKMPPSLVGLELGQWKVELDNIVSADFVAPKVYSMRTLDGIVRAKAKGFSTFGGAHIGEEEIITLHNGESIPVSRFAKARSVIHGQFGLLEGEKRLHLDTEKRIFDGNDSRPIHIEEK